MRSRNTLQIDRMGGGMARVTATGYDPGSGRPLMQIGVEFDQNGVRRVIEDLCRCAGLPEPWKKG
jgi:hypothetical protein